MRLTPLPSYPTGCTGWLWVTSPGTARDIAAAAQVVKFFWIDDVWITGYIAQHLHIEHQVRGWDQFSGMELRLKFQLSTIFRTASSTGQ